MLRAGWIHVTEDYKGEAAKACIIPESAVPVSSSSDDTQSCKTCKQHETEEGILTCQ